MSASVGVAQDLAVAMGEALRAQYDSGLVAGACIRVLMDPNSTEDQVMAAQDNRDAHQVRAEASCREAWRLLYAAAEAGA